MIRADLMLLPQPRLEGLQRTKYIADKAAEIIIVAVSRQPGNGQSGFFCLFNQEIGFSKTGRRSEQCQRTVSRLWSGLRLLPAFAYSSPDVPATPPSIYCDPRSIALPSLPSTFVFPQGYSPRTGLGYEEDKQDKVTM